MLVLLPLLSLATSLCVCAVVVMFFKGISSNTHLANEWEKSNVQLEQSFFVAVLGREAPEGQIPKSTPRRAHRASEQMGIWACRADRKYAPPPFFILQLQDTLLQKEEELARLHEENNHLRQFLNSALVKRLEEKTKVLGRGHVTYVGCTYSDSKVIPTSARAIEPSNPVNSTWQ